MDNANAYDIASKRILSKKSVLCNIIKECIPEYRDLSKEEIIKCIEDGSENEYIEGLNSDDIGINGATFGGNASTLQTVTDLQNGL